MMLIMRCLYGWGMQLLCTCMLIHDSAHFAEWMVALGVWNISNCIFWAGLE